jgi:putative ABC transport system substrate-binding protein
MTRFWIFDFRFSIHKAAGKRVYRLALCTLLFALCFPAEAQQPRKVPRIGYLALRPSDVDEIFMRELRERGYIDGQNIVIEHRWAAGKVDRLAALAEELVRLNVDVIVASTTPAVSAAKNATKTVPIVMGTAADPVRTGLVASLDRPGGNITGVSLIMPELAGKRIELLKEVLPKLSRVAFLAYGPGPGNRLFVKDAQESVERFGMKFQPVVIEAPDKIEDAFSAILRERAGALMVHPIFIAALEQGLRIAELATKNRLPTISDGFRFAEAGGLIYYGPDYLPLARRAVTYVDKILKGAKPGELPVEQPTKFELVINLKTAKQIGLVIPPNVLARADRVIR